MKTSKWSEVRRANPNPEREASVKKRVNDALVEMSLSELRTELGVTQVQMAAAADMSLSLATKG